MRCPVVLTRGRNSTSPDAARRGGGGRLIYTLAERCVCLRSLLRSVRGGTGSPIRHCDLNARN
eukprot:3334010-Prymnesium_polylepis.1